MVKDRGKSSTQPTRRGRSRRGRSNIRDEEEYLRKTKANLGDEQMLQDHARCHRPDSANPCALKESCDQYLRWQLLESLKFHELASLFGPHLRELDLELPKLLRAANSAITSEPLAPPMIDGDPVQMVRDYLAAQRGISELLKALVLVRRALGRFSELTVKHPMHHFREHATGKLASAGYTYQQIAALVDDDDRDRTRKSRAWRAFEAKNKQSGKRPAQKRAGRNEQDGRPAPASHAPPATPPAATAARADLSLATTRVPDGAPTPTLRASKRRVEQLQHLVGEPVLDQKLDGGPRHI